MFDTILSHLPSGPELVSAIPVIISLIIIEGLLSVDNAMAIAAMAGKLPKHQQQLALKLGIIGAYAFRGLSLVFVAFIAENLWIKAVGALYLVYLMCDHLVNEEDEIERKDAKPRGLIGTIMAIELMDLSLSVDNVVAAVALDKRLWVVCTGVFIGILALRFLAGYCISLIEKYPVLGKVAFLLVGFVGIILCIEVFLESQHVHFHMESWQKFIGIIVVISLSMWYDRSPVGKKVLAPVVGVGMQVMIAAAQILGFVFAPFAWVFRQIKRPFTKPLVAQVAHHKVEPAVDPISLTSDEIAK